MKNMQLFHGLESLISGAVGRGINEWVFVNINRIQQDIMTADYFIFTQDDIWALDKSEVYENDAFMA